MSSLSPDFGPWKIVEKLGEGGQCAVFRVRHEDDGKERALKVMLDAKEGSIERFVAEAQLLMTIDHPNILKVHALNTEGSTPWILMDLLGGMDLDEEITAKGPFEPERAARVIADIANGLAEVHARGVRHRDIKPANIMVGNDGIPKLIDFGIAREITRAHLTQAGMVIGTLAYLPPELFEEDDMAAVQDSETADVYALGQSLYELLTGDTTYPKEGSTTKLMARVMREKLEKPFLDPRLRRAQVPEELAAVVRDATQQEPSARIHTAVDLEKRLRQWLIQWNDLNTAPVSRFDPSQLPLPPTPTPAPARTAQGNATPLPARRAQGSTQVTPEPIEARPPNPTPPEKRGWGRFVLWLASGTGTAIAIAAMIAITTVIVALLGAFRPQARAFDTANGTAWVEAVVANYAGPLGECGLYVPKTERDKGFNVQLDFDVWQGRAINAQVSGLPYSHPSLEGCFIQAIEGMDFSGSPEMHATVPVQLR